MENPTYHLEGVVRARYEMEDFDGPLALILMLLSKNKIAIRDIRVSDILEQYLEYIAKMQSMDIELASEFMQMASQLLYLKTRSLLPSGGEPTELEELISSLEQLRCRENYARLRAVLDRLSAAGENGALLFTKRREPPRAAPEYAYRHTPEELLAALLPMLLRDKGAHPERDASGIVPRPIAYSVWSKTRELTDLLRSRGSERLARLFAECESRSELVATFIAVLELCAAGGVAVAGEPDDLIVTFTADAQAAADSILTKEEAYAAT